MSGHRMPKLILLQFELQQQLLCQQQLEKDKVRDIIDILDVLVLVICDGVQRERHQHEGDGGKTP